MAARKLIGTETRTGRYGQVTIETYQTQTPGAVVEVETDTRIETARSLPGTHPRGKVRVTTSGGVTEWHWRRVIAGRLFSFTRVQLAGGEIRVSVRVHNGYSDLRFGCAWDHVHLFTLIVSDRMRASARSLAYAAVVLHADPEAAAEIYAVDAVAVVRTIVRVAQTRYGLSAEAEWAGDFLSAHRILHAEYAASRIR